MSNSTCNKLLASINKHWHNPLIHEMHRVSHVHFIGIGGSGMCGLAQILKNEGYSISGSDQEESANTAFLKNSGIPVFKGHHECQINQADVIIVSAAISSNNPELKAAAEQRIPVISRAEMLAEIMRFRHGIAVAGTHGKTTTTSIIASILGRAGLDPTFVIGGRLNSAGTHANLGKSRILVAEADESDASFLHLQPMVAVITNIEQDHMSTYGGSVKRLHDTFISFLHNIPFYGLIVLCLDDPGNKAILPKINRHLITYGKDNSADITAINIQQNGPETTFQILDKISKITIDVKMNLPGEHNVLNALAAYAVTKEEGITSEEYIKGLAHFSGVDRRFQIYGDFTTSIGSVLMIDDYGHHPSEVAVTISAIRKGWPDRRIVMIFQPHRYSRTSDMYDDFVKALSEVDVLLILDIYEAEEEPISGITSESLCKSINEFSNKKTVYLPNIDNINNILANTLHDNDILITQGAGNVGKLAKKIALTKLEFLNRKIDEYA